MSKGLYLVAGAALGVAVGLAYDYLFSPATPNGQPVRFDETYQSRLDWALEEGELAADAREIELRREFEVAKHKA
jgi:hypothetical protein